MKRSSLAPPLLFALIVAGLQTGCGRTQTAGTSSAPPKHEHHPPHGGTPVVLGEEVYHLELVRDASEGLLQAFVLDGEMENFVRSSVVSIEIDAEAGSSPKILTLSAVANSATGETVGDTSLFEGKADWLKTVSTFDAVIKSITVRGTTFTAVRFNFPRGNDTD